MSSTLRLWTGHRRAGYDTGVGIRSWGSRRIKRYIAGDRGRYDAQLRPKIDELVRLLRADAAPADLTVRGWRVHLLAGDRKGQHTVALAGRWRLVFRFKDGDAYDVDVLDYHKS